MSSTAKLQERIKYLREYGCAFATHLGQSDSRHVDFIVEMIARMIAEAEQTREDN